VHITSTTIANPERRDPAHLIATRDDVSYDQSDQCNTSSFFGHCQFSAVCGIYFEWVKIGSFLLSGQGSFWADLVQTS